MNHMSIDQVFHLPRVQRADLNSHGCVVGEQCQCPKSFVRCSALRMMFERLEAKGIKVTP